MRDLPFDVVVDGRIGGRAEMLAMAVVGLLLIGTAATLLAALGRLDSLATATAGGGDRVLGLLGLYGAAGFVMPWPSRSPRPGQGSSSATCS